MSWMVLIVGVAAIGVLVVVGIIVALELGRRRDD